MKKVLSALISVVLAVTLCVTTCTSAFAATFNGKKYVKEMIISYGKTEEEAKKWLTDNDYEVIDNNLNDGADDLLSTKRAVYVGYKTTDNADEAITDMKVMNMKGGYSVQDYQMLLDEQKESIKSFFSNFEVAVQEYRDNYKANKGRAIAAHDMLNMLYDDDTKQYMGDLLLNRVREEYTDEEYNLLSDDEKAKVADMTTILMQGNAEAVLSIEQTIATAADDSDELWFERYNKAKTYDEMLDELMDKDNLTVTQARKKLAAEYDSDAEAIASKLEAYKTLLEEYTNADISITSTSEEVEAYKSANEDFEEENWVAAGMQYELLKTLKNDDVTLLDLITSDDFDLDGSDRYMLYPLVSVLSKGQRACLDFLTMYQIISLGINNDKASKQAVEETDTDTVKSLNVSVYSGVDRTIFTDQVALTGEAYKLQSATGEDAMGSLMQNISSTSLVLLCCTSAGILATVAAWTINSAVKPMLKNVIDGIKNDIEEVTKELKNMKTQINQKLEEGLREEAEKIMEKTGYKELKINGLNKDIGYAKSFQKAIHYAGIAITCITLVLAAVTIWSTYQDIKAYYNAEFTPIPLYMVNQGVDEYDKKTYTYYTAVKCNREAQGMVTDNTKLLGDSGDLNGDVGKQWVALYTTKDKSAGDPITTDFVVQTGNSDVPADSTALSIFCESVAQNLTNKKAGYTYADSKNGIYLFYGTDESAFAGSAISNGTYALIGGGVAIIVAAVAFYLGTVTEKKKGKKQNA